MLQVCLICHFYYYYYYYCYNYRNYYNYYPVTYVIITLLMWINLCSDVMYKHNHTII